MLRVYVAGAYSASNVIDVLANMRRGLNIALDVLDAGHAPFAPWLDFQFGLLRNVTLDQYRRFSMAWLEAADVVLVVPEGSGTSVGTQAEIQRAAARGIPVVWSIKELKAYASKT